MKPTNKLLMIVAILCTLTTSVYAQSPREELQQMVERLQNSPSDTALRKQIIKLALTLKPAPALPPEAERRMVRGSAAFKGATSVMGYQDAAKEFEQATLAAPWYGDAYFNLGVTQDKAENYEAALRSLKLARLASPDSKEIQTLIYEVEYRQEKANSPEVRAAREREAEQRFITSLEGAKFVCPEHRSDDDAWQVEIEIGMGKIKGSTVTTWIHPRMVPGVNYASNAYVGFRGTWFEEIPLKGRVNIKRTNTAWGDMRVELDADKLVYESQTGESKSNVYRETCRRIN